jgi:hypothetical protein
VSSVVAATRWRDQRGLTVALTVLFCLMVVTSALLAVALADRITVVRDFRAGRFGDVVGRAQDADDFVSSTNGLFLLNQLAVGVLFVVWLFRAAKDNEALDRQSPRFAPGWAVGAWFIPLANFVLPVMLVQDLWRGSDPTHSRGDTNWRRARGSALVGAWWAAWLLSFVRFAASGAGFNGRGSLADIERSNTIAFVGVGITAIAAVLALLVVHGLTRRQLECLHAQRAAWEAATATPG